MGFRRTLGLSGLLLGILAAAVACQDIRHGIGADLTAAPKDALRLATYNVHYINLRASDGRWSSEGWDARKSPMLETVKALGADVIAFQEMETFAGGDDDSVNLTRSFLLERLPDYAAAAIGDWRTFPSTQPIFYRKARMDLTDEGWFFFSETPDVIYSRTFDGSYPAFASWAAFLDLQTGAEFRVVNLHTDYSSRQNRQRSAALVAERIRPWIDGGETVFLAGDLNARAGSALHTTLEGAGLGFVSVPGATYHLDIGLNLFGAIDHIAYSGEAQPAGTAAVFRERLGAVWPTDHYPVVADFDLVRGGGIPPLPAD